MSSNEENRKAVIILTAICVGLLAIGIPLAASTETIGNAVAPGNMWKLVLGVMLASFGGFGLIGIIFVALRNRATKGMLNPYNAYDMGDLSADRYHSIIKKEKIAAVIVSVLAIVMLVFWFNSFSVLLAGGMILGAVGAVMLADKGRGTLIGLGVSAGIVVGIISALTTKIDTSKQYAYFVNGVKVGEGNGAAGSFFSNFLGGALFAFMLILGIAYLITIICTMATKNS